MTIETLLDLPSSEPWRTPVFEASLQRYAREALPDLPSYRSVDLALAAVDRASLVARADEWNYFVGSEAPSPGLEWTRRGFDDTRWKTGPSALGYDSNPSGSPALATVVEGLQGKSTTVYLRREFDVERPERVVRARLAVKADDGFVAFLNGEEIGRHLAPEGRILPHDAVATGLATEPLRDIELRVDPSALRERGNVLAIQGLNESLESSDFTLLPILRVDLRSDLRSGRELQERFLLSSSARSDAGSQGRRDYLEARLLQREEKHEDALKLLGASADLLSQPEALLANARSLVAIGRAREVGELITAHCENAGKKLWDIWLAGELIRAENSFDEMLRDFPCTGQNAYVDDVRWLLERLKARDVVRINCGGEDFQDSSGNAWRRDGFFTTGRAYRRDPAREGLKFPTGVDDELYRTQRLVSRTYRDPVYVIPFPRGRYRITFHFVELNFSSPGRRVFDVIVEGKAALEAYETPAARRGLPDLQSIEINVDDGLLEIGLDRRVHSPAIAALEIERLPNSP